MQAIAQDVAISPAEKAQIDASSNEYLSTNNIPGMAVGIIRNGKVLYAQGYGVAMLGGTDSITTSTTFHMASISKPFVSIAIMQLREEGKLQLDDQVIKHLPYFKMADQRFSEMTIKQLLLHTNGIPDVGPSENYNWDKPEYDEESLERFVRSLETWKLEFKPGKKCRYSNTGYNILGDIIAKVSGLSFEDYMKQKLLNPVGMTGSSFYFPEIDSSNIATPHILTNGITAISSTYPYNRAHGPSGTLNSNIDDMSKFVICVLNQGELNGTRLYNEESHRILTTPLIRRNKIVELSPGWEIAPFRDTSRIDFSGRDVGFNTYLMMVPSETFAIILLINHFDVPPAFKVINTAYDVALKY